MPSPSPPVTPAADSGASPSGPALRAKRNVGWIGPVFLALLFAALVSWSWGRWLDLVVDFGRELYVPWQLAEGRRLQIDIRTAYGPLSHVLNSWWFRLLGVSLQTLVFANLAVLAGVTALLYAMSRRIGSHLSATVACATFLVIFGFGHLMPMGNFNFVTPYSHEATHGFALGMAGLCCFLRYQRRPRRRWALCMGACMGLVFLTKPEMFVAIAGSLAVGIALVCWSRGGLRACARAALPVAAGFLVPILAMLIVLSIGIPLRAAIRETCGAWALLGNSRVAGLAFYANSTGFDDPGKNLRSMAFESSMVLLTVLPLFLVCWFAGRSREPQAGIAAGVFTAIGSFCIWLFFGWTDPGSCLVPAILLLLAVQVVQLVRRWKTPADRDRAIAWVTTGTFAFLVMLKMILRGRFMQFGFVLGAFPAVLLVNVLVESIPATLRAAGRNTWLYRGLALAVIGLMVIGHAIVSDRMMALLTTIVGSDRDAFFADYRGAAMDDMLQYLAASSRPQDTLTVLPEGAMLNYLSRRRSPVPYTIFTPADMVLFGEEPMRQALEAGNPAYIAIMHRPTEPGNQAFGSDYGMPMARWIAGHYAVVHQSGAFPFASPEFGILLLKRKDLVQAAAPAGERPAENAPSPGGPNSR